MAKHSFEQERLQALLRQLRLDAELRQVDLAEQLGQPQSYVSKYESGERRLDFLEVRQVCRVLGQPLAEFVRRFEEDLRWNPIRISVILLTDNSCSGDLWLLPELLLLGIAQEPYNQLDLKQNELYSILLVLISEPGLQVIHKWIIKSEFWTGEPDYLKIYPDEEKQNHKEY